MCLANRLSAVIAEQSTRLVIRQLKRAGFRPTGTRGSHTKWQKGANSIIVPDGHKTISPGVDRKILKVIEETQ